MSAMHQTPDEWASGRSLEDLVCDFLLSPVTQEKLKPLEATVRDVLTVMSIINDQLFDVARRFENPKLSRGYERRLIDQGFDKTKARVVACRIIRKGINAANDRKNLSIISEALRFVSKGNRRGKELSRRISVLFSASKSSGVFEGLFPGGQIDRLKFHFALEAASRGDKRAYEKVRSFALQLSSGMPRVRGPSISPASMTHELFLELSRANFGKAGYQWDSVEGRCSDPVTEATRLEFGDNHFDSRPAHRRCKARRKVSRAKNGRKQAGR